MKANATNIRQQTRTTSQNIFDPIFNTSEQVIVALVLVVALWLVLMGDF